MDEDFATVLDEGADDSTSSCSSRKRVILHFDIDCFYAQVEMIKDPSLRSIPLGIKQKNIVVTCNYVAREKGVVKCAYITDAMKICPELVLVNGEDLSDYRQSSQQIFDLVYAFGGSKSAVEKLGMDENFMDATELVEDKIAEMSLENLSVNGCTFGQATKSCTSDNKKTCACHQRLMIGSIIASEIRQKLFDELGITSSCGIAHNKVLAKVGGGQNKPNKQTVIFHETALELMSSLKSPRSIPGLGSSTFELLKERGIHTIEDLQNANADQLKNVPDSQRLIELSVGKDDSPVKLSGKPLSIGLEDRFKCISTKAQCLEKAQWLLGRLAKLVLQDGRKPQTLKVFIRDFEKDKNDPKRKFAKYSRQCKVNPSNFKDESSIIDHANQLVQLISKMVDFGKYFHLTLMGVAVTDFVSQAQKGGIENFFKGKIGQSTKIEMADQIPTASTSSSVSQNKIDAFLGKRAPTQEMESAAKKAKFEKIPDDWDPDVFNSLPEDMKEELMKSNGTRKSILPKEPDIPSQWDAQVFTSLPEELQKELMRSQKSATPNKQKPANKKSGSILNYFGKKSNQ